MATLAEDLDDLPEIVDVSSDGSWAMLDEECRVILGMSAEEFARRYNAGEYDDPDDDPRIMSLAMHLEHLQQPLSVADV